jgi:Ca2+-binding RTX toxin-like protein
MSVTSISRVGVVIATMAATAAIATPSAFAASVTLTSSGNGVVGDSVSVVAKVGSGRHDPSTLQVHLIKGTTCGAAPYQSSNVFSNTSQVTFKVNNVQPAGTYLWAADLKESGASQPTRTCSGSFTIAKATPSVSTVAVNGGTGGYVHDTATISGRKAQQNNQAGVKIAFGLYAPGDTTCSGTPVGTSVKTVGASANTYASDPIKVNSAGTYRWKVVYSGDINNNAVTVPCGTSTSVVTDGGGPPPPSGPTCDGLLATIVGTSAGETIIGTPGRDVIVAKGGADTVVGRGGNDVICGGDGNDVLRGRVGNDVIRGGAGSDVIRGGKGNDQLYGGTGGDDIGGNAGNDRLYGGKGNDNLDGGTGTDFGNGGPGTDIGRSIEFVPA